MSSFTILTQYYPPETGAPQNRLHSLAMWLKRKGYAVRVVTAMPNYPKNKIYPSYLRRYSFSESIDEITVYRSWIYVSPSRGIVARLLNYFSFVITSFIGLLRLPRTEFIICESPPLFLGITAVLISKIKHSKLVFNVSDLWPESAEKLNIISNRFLIRLAYRLEHWIYRKSYLISGQTKGIVKSIKSRFPEKRVIWFPNGVDIDFFDKPHDRQISWRSKLEISESDFLILYAGILGHAQGLEVILNAADILKDQPLKFLIVGDGPEKERLIAMAESRKLQNVVFEGNLQKSHIPSLIESCDAYIVPLKKLDLFKGAIPSKLFEPLALGKPILLGVDGEARDLFIKEGQAGLYFEPENASDLTAQVRVLLTNRQFSQSLGKQGQQFVRLHFDRSSIHEIFLKELLS